MSGEPSEQPKKRGRPKHSLTDNKKKKNIMDQRARQEIRDIVVKLKEATPDLKQVFEALSSIDVGACLQTVGNIQDIIARWNEGVQWQQDSMGCIQEIKDAMSEAVSKGVLPLRNDLQSVKQTVVGERVFLYSNVYTTKSNVNLPMASQALGCQYNQNPVQSDAFDEPQNIQYEDQLNAWDVPSFPENPNLNPPSCSESIGAAAWGRTGD
ncbi:putative FAM48B2 [Gossypium australe]|uniref:Putative FAM48B2 n=1 Tax=Gossypium australe TaxID=47621 RepID=A0A5B6VJG5_9ROSI|nr:putative FAM48B2 [Gossypium australe]